MKRFLAVVILCCVAPLFAQAPERPFDDAPGPHMTRRAAIRVLTIERLQQEHSERQQIFDLLHTMSLTRRHISTSDPVIRQQLELEGRVEEAIRGHLDQDLSDDGKSVIAVAVQRKLNAMEGQSNCRTCHGRAALDVARVR